MGKPSLLMLLLITSWACGGESAVLPLDLATDSLDLIAVEIADQKPNEPSATISCVSLYGQDSALIAIDMINRDAPFWQSHGQLELVFQDGLITSIPLSRGAAVAILDTSSSGLTVNLDGQELGVCSMSKYKDFPVFHEAGSLAREHWGPDEVIIVGGDLTIPKGTQLSIDSGTQVILGDQVNITIDGDIFATGTQAAPIVFQAKAQESPWGGVVQNGGQGLYEWAFFTQGGARFGAGFGHSASQPVILAKAGELSLEHVFIFDNPGKALGSEQALVNLTSCLVARCDTGGEFKHSLVTVEASHFMEIPDGDGVAADDDNDCLYFGGAWAGAGESRISESVFYLGEDDGIDHNGAKLTIEDCYIEGFHHEGIACSNGGHVAISNTVVRGCDQGIEAGYGAPQVTVDHSLLMDNKVGLRVGDSYDWEVGGSLIVTSTISWANGQDNVLNYVNDLGGPLEGALDISWSMVDDPDWDGVGGNTPGAASLDTWLRLAPASNGVGSGADGSNPGLH
jgi:Right handed beta helix region